MSALTARAFYWVGGASGDEGNWTNVNNWAPESGGTPGTAHGIDYPRLPGDIAIMDDGNNGYDITSGTSGISISAFIDVGDGSYALIGTGLIVGGAIIHSYLPGGIVGDCIFEGDGAVISGSVTGDCIFSGVGSYLYGASITGSCIFSGTDSKNDGGTIVGDCMFSGPDSYNSGSITGNCIFSGSGSDNSSSLTGAAIFTGSGSTNQGTIAGPLIPLVPITNSGTATRHPLDVLGSGLY